MVARISRVFLTRVCVMCVVRICHWRKLAKVVEGKKKRLSIYMATSRLPPTALNLKQFIQRQKVLGLYRSMLRTIRRVPDASDRQCLKSWAREEFQRNKGATDQDAIRMMITQGNMHLQDLQKTLQLAGS